MKYEFKEEETSYINKKDQNTTITQIFMSDYPDLDGTTSTWPDIKEKLRRC